MLDSAEAPLVVFVVVSILIALWALGCAWVRVYTRHLFQSRGAPRQALLLKSVSHDMSARFWGHTDGHSADSRIGQEV